MFGDFFKGEVHKGRPKQNLQLIFFYIKDSFKSPFDLLYYLGVFPIEIRYNSLVPDINVDHEC